MLAQVLDIWNSMLAQVLELYVENALKRDLNALKRDLNALKRDFNALNQAGVSNATASLMNPGRVPNNPRGGGCRVAARTLTVGSC